MFFTLLFPISIYNSLLLIFGSTFDVIIIISLSLPLPLLFSFVFVFLPQNFFLLHFVQLADFPKAHSSWWQLKFYVESCLYLYIYAALHYIMLCHHISYFKLILLICFCVQWYGMVSACYKHYMTFFSFMYLNFILHINSMSHLIFCFC